MILQPPSTLVVGPTGVGKSFSIATQLLCGLKSFVVVTEPGGVESILDACERLKAPVDNLHWTTCVPAAAGFMGLQDMVEKINSFDQKQLSDIRDLGKSSFREAGLKFLRAFSNFTSERTGEVFGDFTKWDDTCCMNIDTLTGWSQIAWGTTVGYKPTANPGEWGIAQNFIMNMLVKIMTDRKCYLNLTAHLEKEVDEMSGVKKAMVSTIGAKLAPKIPPMFSEVILAKKINGNEFYWSTMDPSVDLKNRALPVGDKLKPDFAPIIAAYERRKKLAGGSSPPPTTAQQAPPVIPAAPLRPQTAN